MTILQLILLAIGHAYGDFYFQTEKMALNKWHSWKALFSHVITYMGCIVVAMLIAPGTTVEGCFAFAGLNGLLHLITDRITSKIMRDARLYENQRGFFLTLGGDQATHMICFYLTSPLLLL